MQSATATHLLRSLPHRRPSPLPRSPSAAGPNGIDAVGSYETPKPQRDLLREWVSENDDFVRVLPIYVGGFSLLAVLLNRSFSNIPPVADASSSQSRADILSLALAVTNILAGLVWLSIRPKNISPSVILQPIGNNGVAIIGGNTIRGFNNIDQAWITLIAEKLEATLSTS